MERIEEDLEKVRKFLDENGIELTLTDSQENYIDYDNDEIVVSKGQSKKHILFTILHEIGHYFSEIHFEEESKASIVIEEVIAWDRGFDVATALRIDIDEQSWLSLMESCISKYMD